MANRNAVGYEAALDLARRGARVILACRNLAKGGKAVQRIQNVTGNNSVECRHLDLSSLASVRAFAANIGQECNKIHAVILNAGVWFPMQDNKTTSDGFEIHFGVNHLAHFELIKLLLDHLMNCRIIFVASSLAKSGQIDFDSQDFVKKGRRSKPNEQPSFAPTGYCDSKLMNILCSKHLATTVLPDDDDDDGDDSSVTSYAVCPGFCRSSLARNVHVSWLASLVMLPLMWLVQRTTVQGAQNIIFLVVTDKSRLQSGAVYSDGAVDKAMTQYVESRLPVDAPRRLWEVSEKVANEIH